MTFYEKKQKCIQQIEEEIFDSILELENYSCFANKSIELDEGSEDDDELFFRCSFDYVRHEEKKEFEFIICCSTENDDMSINIEADWDDGNFDKVRCFNADEFWRKLFFCALDS